MSNAERALFRVSVIGLLLAGPMASSLAVGSGLFDTWTGYPTGYYANSRFPSAAADADLNGDQRRDVLVARWPWATGLAVLLNQGDGVFSAAAHYASPLPALDVAAGDFDGDGLPDAVVSNTGVNWEGNTVSLYRSLGAGLLTSGQAFLVGSGSFVGPIGLAADDFDDDGHLDLAVAKYGYLGQGSTVALLLGDGEGSLGAPRSFPAGDGPHKLAAGDLDGDHLPDLAVANEDLKMTILLNDGAGGFASPTSYDVITIPFAGDAYPTVALADVDNDGDSDVLYGSTGTLAGTDTGAIALFRNLGDGTFSSSELVPLVHYTGGPVDIAAGDLDGDGWVDLLGANLDGRASDGWQVAMSDANGGFRPAVLHPSGQHTAVVMATDVDNDLALDVLTVDHYSMAVMVHRNLGGGEFRVPPTYPVEPLSLDLDAADVDGDGDLDILTTGGTTAGTQASVLINQGDGTFAPHVVYTLPGGLAYGRLRDVSGDGRVDLLMASASPPYDFHTALNNGDGTFGAITTWPIGNCGSGHLDAADLDDDGDLDVCFLEYLACPGIPESGRRLYVSLNRGDGTFDLPAIILVDGNPFAIRAGDIDGDGNADLAIAHWGIFGGNDTVAALLGRGDGTFQPPAIYTVGQGPVDIVIADLDGDSIPDLATANTGAGAAGIETMSVLVNTGNGSFGNAVTYDGAYSPDLLGTTGIAAGDPDGDDDVDLMVGNGGSSDVCFYANRGGGTFDPPMRYGLNKYAFAPFYADFTGDGVGDLAAVVGLPPSGTFGAVTIVEGLGAVVTVGGEGGGSPRLALGPGLPNPVRSSTVLSYAVPDAGPVRLCVYDVRGRLVRRLVDSVMAPGRHRAVWNGRDEKGRLAGSGVYFVRLATATAGSTGKLSVVR
jgi:hypothetical protein